MDNHKSEDIKQALQNPAILPSYRATLEKKLKELTTAAERPAEAPATPAKRQLYQGVANMSLDEIVSFFSERGFYRLDTPITGVQALQSIYERMGILGYDREVVLRVATAIQRLGGEVPEMIHLDISDLLRKE